MKKALSFKLSAISRKSKCFLAFFIFILTAYSLKLTTAHAEPVSSAELIERAKEFDGRTMTYKGEAVTAILDRGEFSWVTLNDGANAIGVWCKTSDLDGVKFIGDYKHKGDILEVDGILNRACASHGGELDIHANSIRIMENGHAVKNDMDAAKIIMSIILFSAALAVTVIFRKRI